MSRSRRRERQKQRRQGVLCALLLLSVGSENLMSMDLVEVYRLADRVDPRHRQAQANLEGIREDKNQARANLLPQLSLEANAYANKQDVEANFPPGGTSTKVNFGTHSYRLALRQTLFNWDQFLQLKQADQRVLQAMAELRDAQQDLLLRVADSYFRILATEENLDFVGAEKRALNRQLKQAQQRFEVGLGTIIDVEEAQAGYDQAHAKEIQTRNELDSAYEQLREITGEYIHESKILDEGMPLDIPQPDDIESWVKRALQNNPRVHAAWAARAQVEEEIERRGAGHLPSLALVGNHGLQSSGGRFGDSETETSAVGVEFKLPLYQGGRVSSQVRQAEQTLNGARERLEQAKREVQRRTRQAFLGAKSSISQIDALAQAVRSSETALRAIRAGFEVGTRTSVDVVTSERTLSGARRDYAQARYQYILQNLQLQQAAGTLTEQSLEQVNLWLRDPEAKSSLTEESERHNHE